MLHNNTAVVLNSEMTTMGKIKSRERKKGDSETETFLAGSTVSKIVSKRQLTMKIG